MELQDRKCVMILNEELPAGVLANTAGILGITLGKKGAGEYRGPIFMIKTEESIWELLRCRFRCLRRIKEKLKAIRERLYQPEFAECVVVDFTDVAQCCQNYEGLYSQSSRGGRGRADLSGYRDMRLQKLVNRLSGSLPLLR